MKRLIDFAKVLRSKNAGPLSLTLDIIFPNKTIFEHIINSKIITKELISDIYNVEKDDVLIIKYEIVNSIKITIPRRYVSGSIFDTDIYGCQQHVPLSNVLISEEDSF